MRIAPPNYTQAPNFCFDDLFKTLKEGELRVILVIIRQTFGWHKPADRISLSKLAEKSGMNRPSVCRSLNSLIEKGLVVKKKFGEIGQERCYYTLVLEPTEEDDESPTDGIESEEEMQIISNNLYQSPKETRPVSLGDQTSLLKRPTKETNTKETTQKKQQQAKPSAAAASSEEKPKAKIHPKLQNLDIPYDQKVVISAKYDEKTISEAVEWATDPDNPPEKSLVASIKFACNNKLSIQQKKHKLSAYEIISKSFKHGNFYNDAECHLKPDGVAFMRGMKHEGMKFDEFFSWEKFRAMCKSFGIKYCNDSVNA